MSEMKAGLLSQIAAEQEPDVGKVFKKMFPDVPVIDATEERLRFQAEQRLNAQLKELQGK